MPYPRKPTAVMNEQTAALTVMPIIRQLLMTAFDFVIPINFWSTREGTGKAIAVFEGMSMQVVAVYPRRAKTLDDLPGSIFIKINQKLYDHAVELESKGIPVFAAASTARSLLDLANASQCCYIPLIPGGAEDIFEVDIESATFVEPRINDVEFLSLIADKAKTMNYQEAAIAIRESFRRSHHYVMASLWGQYKPIYFLCASPK